MDSKSEQKLDLEPELDSLFESRSGAGLNQFSKIWDGYSQKGNLSPYLDWYAINLNQSISTHGTLHSIESISLPMKGLLTVQMRHCSINAEPLSHNLNSQDLKLIFNSKLLTYCKGMKRELKGLLTVQERSTQRKCVDVMVHLQLQALGSLSLNIRFKYMSRSEKVSW